MPHKGKRIQLQGIRPDITKCIRVSTHKLKGLLKKKSVTHCVQLRSVSPAERAVPIECMSTDLNEQVGAPVSVPPEVPAVIQTLVQKHSNLFHHPNSLPPSRIFYRKIALLPGAQPVNVRPYRYAPH